MTTKQDEVKFNGMNVGNTPFVRLIVVILCVVIPVGTFFFNYRKDSRTESDIQRQAVQAASERTALVSGHTEKIKANTKASGVNTVWRIAQVKTATKRSSGHDNRDAQIATLQNADVAKEATLSAIRDWILRQDPDADIPPVVYEIVYPKNFNGTASDD